jgi:hypothetical protein
MILRKEEEAIYKPLGLLWILGTIPVKTTI